LSTDQVPVVGTSLDVTRRADVEAIVARSVSDWGRVDVLVNLAGVLRNQVITKIDDADFAAVLDTHLHGTLNLMRATLPHMHERGYGRIVNMSSVAARGTVAGGAYGAAKAAIEGLTRSAALESATRGVTINCIAPGLVDGGMFRSVREDYQQELEAKIPMGRVAEPSEIAACVIFLASPAASYVTGQTLVACGGMTLGL
jgi:3-oxoacyl-[acyl-carrier protein] reductase